ncbi:MAG: hypothetical protein ACRERC_26780 [Candidatus Binatia bacterium]
MHKQILSLSLAALFCLAANRPAFADAISSPGKASAYVSTSGVSIPLFAAIGASVQILKGKKKRVLEVDITVIDPSSVVDVIGIRASVNGLFIMEPTTTYQVEHACDTAYVSCTAHGVYWLDLDTAEASFPGQFINVPLNIDATVIAGGTATTGNVSLRARLVKK